MYEERIKEVDEIMLNLQAYKSYLKKCKQSGLTLYNDWEIYPRTWIRGGRATTILAKHERNLDIMRQHEWYVIDTMKKYFI